MGVPLAGTAWTATVANSSSMIGQCVRTTWTAHSSSTGSVERPLATVEVAAALAAVDKAGGTVAIDQWRTFWTYGNGGALIRYWPRWVRSAPTAGTWAALRRIAYLPRIDVRRGRGLRVGYGSTWTASNTTWAMIDRGWIEVDGEHAAVTAIGWRMLTEYGFDEAITAARRAVWRTRNEASSDSPAASAASEMVRAA